jgi:hypothetical protein
MATTAEGIDLISAEAGVADRAEGALHQLLVLGVAGNQKAHPPRNGEDGRLRPAGQWWASGGEGLRTLAAQRPTRWARDYSRFYVRPAGCGHFNLIDFVIRVNSCSEL